jgi:hypothetical protein
MFVGMIIVGCLLDGFCADFGLIDEGQGLY